MLPVFEIGIVSAALCGLIMVGGGILLLHKGAVNLKQTSGDEAVSLEFQKMLKLTTRYPALGLFIIGLSFVLAALAYSRPPSIRPLQIYGKITGSEPSALTVRILADQWLVQPSSDGTFAHTIYSKMDKLDALRVELTSPGRPTQSIYVVIKPEELKTGVAPIGEIPFSSGEAMRKPVPDESARKPVGEKFSALGGKGSFS